MFFYLTNLASWVFFQNQDFVRSKIPILTHNIVKFIASKEYASTRKVNWSSSMIGWLNDWLNN